MSDPASSLVGFFFYFFAGVSYISTMPRRRSVAREVNCLSYVAVNVIKLPVKQKKQLCIRQQRVIYVSTT